MNLLMQPMIFTLKEKDKIFAVLKSHQLIANVFDPFSECYLMDVPSIGDSGTYWGGGEILHYNADSV